MNDVLKGFANTILAMTKLGSIAAALAIVTTGSARSEFKPVFIQKFSYENEAVLTDATTGISAGLENVASSLSKLAFNKKHQSGAKLSFGIDVEAKAYPHISLSAKNSINIFGAYQTDLGDDKNWQLRLRLDHKASATSNDWIFKRTRIGAKLQYKHSRTSSTLAHFRIGHRDQNDALFQGYDQKEFLVELTQSWRPNKSQEMYAVTLYAEARRADRAQYSYDEFGIRLAARKPISKHTKLSASLSYYTRNFADDFSVALPLARSDKRIKAKIQLNQKLSKSLDGFAFIGWDENQSNIPTRDYSGPLFGAGLSFRWK